MDMIRAQLINLLVLAGIAQITLALVSPVIPLILKWRTELVKVQPLIKQMFWVYAGYILVTNLCFGLISAFYVADLTNHSNLAKLLTGFIALYWISRVAVQFFYFERINFPVGKWHKLGEALLVTLFIFLSIVYSFACYFNCSSLIS